MSSQLPTARQEPHAVPPYNGYHPGNYAAPGYAPPYQQQHPIMANQGYYPGHPQYGYYGPHGGYGHQGAAAQPSAVPPTYNAYNPPSSATATGSPGFPGSTSGYFAPEPPQSIRHSDSGPMKFDIPEDKLLTEAMDIKIRHSFVRKVYGILFVQLLITFGLALLFNLVPAMANWILMNSWMMFVGIGVALVCIIVLACVPTVARKHPWNLIFLFTLSLAFGIILGGAGASVQTSAFLIACGITAAVTIGLSLFACQTRFDFTGCGVFVFVTLLVLVIFGIIAAIIRNQVVHIVYAALGTLLFSFYIVYDTQQIVGGKHRKYQFSIDDYIFAALALYLDIINLFSFILTLVVASNR